MTTRVGSSRFDVCVVGGGPAGAVAALVLARAGARVALIVRDRPDGAFAIGETVPPETRLLLDRLGVNCLSAGPHLPSAGTVVRWGSDAVHCREAILSPFGCGWHLDRALFERQLISAAVENGAVLINCARVEPELGIGWEFRIDNVGRQSSVVSSFALDCTGRVARLAIAAGARRDIHDKLVAVWCIAEEPDGEPNPDRRIYLESAPDGWLYSARMPDRRRVVAYFTDGDLCDAALRSAAGFAEFVAKTFHPNAGDKVSVRRIAAGPYYVNAASARLERAFDERWIAAGDAAQSFDPLSSQGITAAIIGGNNAAAALIAARSSDVDALEKYQSDLDAGYTAYRSERQAHYRAEQRWVERPFWRRRFGDLAETGGLVASRSI